jgi:hypothetical protein
MRCQNRPLLGLSILILAYSCRGASAEDAKSRALLIESIQPITLDTADAAKTSQTLNLRIRLSEGQPPATFEVVEAHLEKRATNFAAAFKFGPIQGSAPELEVPLEINLTKLPFAGKYEAKVRPVERPVGQAQAGPELEMTFERPFAQLAPLEEVLFDRDWVSGHIVPDKLYITEQSNVAFVRFSFPLVSGQVRGPTGEVLASQFILNGKGVLGSGERLALVPVADGNFPLGSSSGTIRLESPQLAAPVDLKFRLVSRFWFGFLPLTIALFILFGLLYRKLLADHQELDEGLLQAQRSYARLKTIADTQTEPRLQAAISDAIASLASAIRSAESAAALRTAAEEAGKSVDELLKDAAESRTRSRAAIAGLKGELGSSNGHSAPIADAIEAANLRLDAHLRDLDQGLSQSVETQLAAFGRDLAQKISAQLLSLTTAIKRDLDQIGPWPDTEIEKDRDSLVATMDNAEKIGLDKLAEAVRAGLEVARSARLFFTRSLRLEVAHVVRETLNILRPSADDPAFLATSAVQTRLSADGPLIDREAPFHELADVVRSLRDRLSELIRAKLSGDATAVNEALANGDFLAAAKASAAVRASKPKVESFGPRGAAPPGTLAEGVMVPQGSSAPAPTLRIIFPVTAQVGQRIKAHALVEPRWEGATASWTVVTGDAGRVERNGFEFVFSPITSGDVTILCEVSHPDDANKLSGQVAITVGQSAAERATIAIRERLDRREMLMSVITGVFIAAAGTMIFSDTFVGSWRDFLFAALWGFTADVGTGRLRELSQPLTSKAIPGLASTK